MGHPHVYGAGGPKINYCETHELAKKGSAKRQREYAERTAGKAMRQMKAHRGNSVDGLIHHHAF
jgi:hypothetical protein